MDEFIGIEVGISMGDGDCAGAYLEEVHDDRLVVSRYDDKRIDIPWARLLGVTGWRRPRDVQKEAA